MNDNKQTTQNQSAEDILKLLTQGKLNEVVPADKRKVKMVEMRNKVPNVILRKTVEKLRKGGKLNDSQILDKLLEFDELAEKGKLVEHLNKLKVNKKK